MSDGSTDGQGRKPRARVYQGPAAPAGRSPAPPPGFDPGPEPPPSAAPPGGTPTFRAPDAARAPVPEGGPVRQAPEARTGSSATSRTSPSRPAGLQPELPAPPALPPAPRAAPPPPPPESPPAAPPRAVPEPQRVVLRETTVRRDPPAGDRVRLSGRTAVQPDPRQRFPRQEDLADGQPQAPDDRAGTPAFRTAEAGAPGAGPRMATAPRAPVLATTRPRSSVPMLLAITSLLAVAGVGLWLSLGDDGRSPERERALPPRAVESASTQARVREAELQREEELLRDRQARALEETRTARPGPAGASAPSPGLAQPAPFPPAPGFELERRAQAGSPAGSPGAAPQGRLGELAALPLPPIPSPRGTLDPPLRGQGLTAPPPPSELRAPDFEGQPRIVLHHRQGARLAAETVAGVAAGYGPLPEIRQVPATPDAPVVRYFHASDRPAAESLLRRLGGNWSLQDFTTFAPKPRAGTLEVWLPGS